MSQHALTEPFEIAGIRIPNRVMLAPLAGIGNWFVRLQARRYGAGMAVSEMVSSHAIHYGNEKTLTELLRIDPHERTVDDVRGPVSIQLFGQDPEVMRSAAATVAERGADLIDLNMGCPVPKVCKTGAGAALIKDPDTAVQVALAARRGQRPAGHREAALRALARGRPTAMGWHGVWSTRPASARSRSIRAARRSSTRARPTTSSPRKLVAELPVPVILSGGLSDDEHVLAAYEQTGAAAVMLARGALGNPWLFSRVLGLRDDEPTTTEVLAELDWVIDRAEEHLGAERAGRYLRKFYPWYLERLGSAGRADQGAFQAASSVNDARALVRALEQAPVPA